MTTEKKKERPVTVLLVGRLYGDGVLRAEQGSVMHVLYRDASEWRGRTEGDVHLHMVPKTYVMDTTTS